MARERVKEQNQTGRASSALALATIEAATIRFAILARWPSFFTRRCGRKAPLSLGICNDGGNALRHRAIYKGTIQQYYLRM